MYLLFYIDNQLVNTKTFTILSALYFCYFFEKTLNLEGLPQGFSIKNIQNMIYCKKIASLTRVFLFSFTLLMSANVFAQNYNSKGVELIPLEHASLLLKSKKLTIAVDPTGSHHQYEQTIDLILITDKHGDHFNKEVLKTISDSNTTIIAPKAVYDQMDEELQSKTKVLNNGENFNFQRVAIEAIPMYNLREEALNFHSKGRGNGYVVSMNNQRIYISGDTEDIPEMRSLENIDIALVCMNLPYTMTEASAASAVMEFKPKVVMPYHFRGRPKVSDIDLFESLITDSSIEVVRLDWYPNEDY